jgi:hypothetical protein
MDCGGASEVDVAELLREVHPELAGQYPESTLREIAWLILNAELPGLSKHFQALFDEIQWPVLLQGAAELSSACGVRSSSAAKELVFGGHVSSGLILFEERCIYLRYTTSPAMEETLIHEMAHSATTGEHGQEWLYEMARLKAAGAPVPDWELEGLVAEVYPAPGAQSR